ncbi:hypothetical protein BJX99DRAFT_257710 [Aspergillus californicus]
MPPPPPPPPPRPTPLQTSSSNAPQMPTGMPPPHSGLQARTDGVYLHEYVMQSPEMYQNLQRNSEPPKDWGPHLDRMNLLAQTIDFENLMVASEAARRNHLEYDPAGFTTHTQTEAHYHENGRRTAILYGDDLGPRLSTIHERFANIERRQLEGIANARGKPRQSPVGQLEEDEERLCSICFELLRPKDTAQQEPTHGNQRSLPMMRELAKCNASCKVEYHSDCFRRWAGRFERMDQITCPTCRRSWYGGR